MRLKRPPPSVDAAQFARIRRTQFHLGGEARPNAADLDSQNRVSARVPGPRRLKLPYGDASFPKRAVNIYKHSSIISTVGIRMIPLMTAAANMRRSRSAPAFGVATARVARLLDQVRMRRVTNNRPSRST